MPRTHYKKTLEIGEHSIDLTVLEIEDKSQYQFDIEFRLGERDFDETVEGFLNYCRMHTSYVKDYSAQSTGIAKQLSGQITDFRHYLLDNSNVIIVHRENNLELIIKNMSETDRRDVIDRSRASVSHLSDYLSTLGIKIEELQEYLGELTPEQIEQFDTTEYSGDEHDTKSMVLVTPDGGVAGYELEHDSVQQGSMFDAMVTRLLGQTPEGVEILGLGIARSKPTKLNETGTPDGNDSLYAKIIMEDSRPETLEVKRGDETVAIKLEKNTFPAILMTKLPGANATTELLGYVKRDRYALGLPEKIRGELFREASLYAQRADMFSANGELELALYDQHRAIRIIDYALERMPAGRNIEEIQIYDGTFIARIKTEGVKAQWMATLAIQQNDYSLATRAYNSGVGTINTLINNHPANKPSSDDTETIPREARQSMLSELRLKSLSSMEAIRNDIESSSRSATKRKDTKESASEYFWPEERLDFYARRGNPDEMRRAVDIVSLVRENDPLLLKLNERYLRRKAQETPQ